MSEIFPSRIREAGVAIGTSTQWLFNFVFSQVTPHAITNLGWKTFLMFCIFNYSLVVFAWFFIKETKGKSLEEMEACKLSSRCSTAQLHELLIQFVVFGATATAIDVEAVHAKAKQGGVVQVKTANNNKRDD